MLFIQPIRALRLTLLMLPTLWATQSVSKFIGFQDINGWQATDLLINYHSGFVRRGLLGSLLLALNKAGLAINPMLLSLALTLISIWLVALISSTRLLRAPALSGILIAYSPAFIPIFYSLDASGSGRKDALALISLVLSLLLFEHMRSWRRVIWMSGFLAVLLPTLMLSHEGSFFFCFLPFSGLLYLSLRDQGSMSGKQTMAWIAATALPSLLLMISLVVLPNPPVAGVVSMCNAWKASFPALDCENTPTYFSIFHQVSGHTAIARAAFSEPRFYRSLLITSTYLLLMFRGPLLQACRSSLRQGAHEADKRYLDMNAMRCLLISAITIMVPTAPLYSLAPDFGRWFCLSFTTLALASLSPELNRSLSKETQTSLAAINKIARLSGAIKPAWSNAILLMAAPILFLPHFSRPPTLITTSARFSVEFHLLIRQFLNP